jgi:telomerase protein component 1
MNNTLPYMAMMRNLRNILKSGVTDVVHQKIIEKIQNSELIAKAKMFPF